MLLGMFDGNDYLAERSRRVNKTLDAVLPPETEPPEALHRAMRYAVFPGGKRLRPALCMAAAEAVGAPSEAALFPAAAVELLHSYTLVHDDLPCMDNDTERRGLPTVHVAFGEANALLAGDALQALAFDVAARTPVPGAAVAIVRELAMAAGSLGVVGGQVADLAALSVRPSETAMDFIHRHKTADLFSAAIRMGALAAGADDTKLRSLSEYAIRLGVAFQIADDLLDAASDAAGTTRAATSCLQVWDVGTARRKAETLIREALASLARAFSPDRAEPLRAIAGLILRRTE